MNRKSKMFMITAAITLICFSTGFAFTPNGNPVNQDNRTAGPGTVMTAKITRDIGSDRNAPGDPVIAVLTDPVYANGGVVFPRDTEVLGSILSVERPGRLQKNGSIKFVFDRLRLPDGREIGIKANLEGASEYTKSSLKKYLWETAIALGVGIVASKLFGGSIARGILIGGAGAAGYIFFNEGEDVVLAAGTTINLVLEETVSVNYQVTGRTTDTVREREITEETQVVEQQVLEQPETAEEYIETPANAFLSQTLNNGPKITVSLAAGTSLIGTFGGVTQEGKIVLIQNYGKLKIPENDIAEIIFVSGQSVDLESVTQDTFVLISGEKLSGKFAGLSENKLILSGEYGDFRVPINEILKVIFAR